MIMQYKYFSNEKLLINFLLNISSFEIYVWYGHARVIQINRLHYTQPFYVMTKLMLLIMLGRVIASM